MPARSAQPIATAGNRGALPKEQPIIVSLLLIYVVVIGGFLIFMTSRGNRKRQTQAAQMQSALVIGAEVRTIGGLVGEVVELTDEHVVLESTPGVRLKFVKSAVAGVVPPAEPEVPEAVSEQEPADEPAAEADEHADTVSAEPSLDAPEAAGPESEHDGSLHTASPGAKR